MKVISNPSLLQTPHYPSLEDFFKDYGISQEEVVISKGYIFPLGGIPPIGQIQKDGVVIFQENNKQYHLENIKEAQQKISKDVGNILGGELQEEKTTEGGDLILPEGYLIGTVRRHYRGKMFYIDFGGQRENMRFPEEEQNICEFEIEDGLVLVFDFTLTSGFPAIWTIKEAREMFKSKK